jgi:hypothetical protein
MLYNLPNVAVLPLRELVPASHLLVMTSSSQSPTGAGRRVRRQARKEGRLRCGQGILLGSSRPSRQARVWQCAPGIEGEAAAWRNCEKYVQSGAASLAEVRFCEPGATLPHYAPIPTRAA